MCVIDRAEAAEILEQLGCEVELVAFLRRGDVRVCWVLLWNGERTELCRKEFRPERSEFVGVNRWGEFAQASCEWVEQ